MSVAPVPQRKDSHLADLFALLTVDMEPAAAPVLCVVDSWVALNKSLVDGHVQTIDIIVPPDIVLPTTEVVPPFWTVLQLR